jgi:xylulokinase
MSDARQDIHVLVFDVGSSALKAVVFDQHGRIVDRAEAPYARPAANHRQSPWDWWSAAVIAAQQIERAQVGAIALTGTMENLIPISSSGEPLGEALLYSDPCGAPFLAETAAALEEADAVRLCGNTPEPLMTAFKLAWLRRHERERFDRAACFLPGSKDFLALQLTGQLVTDPTCAATTGLMDIASRDWSGPLRAVFGIERRRLPHIRPATDIVGHLVRPAAGELGLPQGLPVINGCGDGGATTIGGGADAASDVSLYLGTTGWVARIAGSGALANRSSFYRLPHPAGEGLIEIAPILSAGAAAAWARSAMGLDLARAEESAMKADAAPHDVLFLPYLNGERSPFLDLELRGAFLGLSPSDGAADLYYAALEGVALAIDANLRAMGGVGRRVSLVGGGALSAIWPQLIADIIGAPIVAPADPVTATSFGAFRLAQRALRLPPSAGSLAPIASPRADRAERAARQRARFATATDLVRQLGPAHPPA